MKQKQHITLESDHPAVIGSTYEKIEVDWEHSIFDEFNDEKDRLFVRIANDKHEGWKWEPQTLRFERVAC